MRFLHAIYKYLKIYFYDNCNSSYDVMCLTSFTIFFLLIDVVAAWKIIDRIYVMEIYIVLLFLFFMNCKCKLNY